jgi:hypothetical protein
MTDDDRRKLGEIYTALVGSLGNPGLMERTGRIEKRVDALDRKIWIAIGGLSVVSAFWQLTH